VQECLEYLGDLAGIPKPLCKERIQYYLEKTSLTEHRRKKMRQLSGGMKRRVGLIQALLSEPAFLIIDEPTTGLDPEERIRIRNLLVDFSENRTVLFSTHVVEDLAATCNQLAVMKKGHFLYAGSVQELLDHADGCVWDCMVKDPAEARSLEQKYRVSSKQYAEGGIQMRILSRLKPKIPCRPAHVTLEDAYIYLTNE
ncbi:MAG: ATP-binding cassette domain-containing protein, partial [Lachnospiraceae bacterium]|nr:ATP-binding cassette domain-containing protein [Lachnospiraceae bacterium]